MAASTASGRVTQNDDNQGTRPAIIGIAITGGTGNVGGTIVSRFTKAGNLATVPGATFTPGDPVFAPDGVGVPVQPAGARVDNDHVTRIGYAETATTFWFIPVEGTIE